MALWIDQPIWPAFGTTFSHLISDQSLWELREFAAQAGLRDTAFDHDHFDVSAADWDRVRSLGAQPASARDLVRRLRDAGLRVPPRTRLPATARTRADLAADWSATMDEVGIDPAGSKPAGLAADLLQAWAEPHRHYHDLRHLAHALAAADRLAGGRAPVHVRLALWFHDAVYQRVPGSDELASAALSRTRLTELGLAAELTEEVARLVELTAGHRPAEDDLSGALVCDADLSILSEVPGRYWVYVRDIRREYPDHSDAEFQVGRTEAIRSLQGHDKLFHVADRGTEEVARANLDEELNWLIFCRTSPRRGVSPCIEFPQCTRTEGEPWHHAGFGSR